MNNEAKLLDFVRKNLGITNVSEEIELFRNAIHHLVNEKSREFIRYSYVNSTLPLSDGELIGIMKKRGIAHQIGINIVIDEIYNNVFKIGNDGYLYVNKMNVDDIASILGITCKTLFK